MLTLTVCQAGKFSHSLPPHAISDALRTTDTVVWLDIKDPSDADNRLLRDEFGFHPLAIEDATRAHERPKVDAYEHALLVHPEGPEDEEEEVASPENGEPGRPGRQAYYFIVFYEARLDKESRRIKAEAINLFVGRNYLVTVHRGDTQHVPDTLARWQMPDSPLGNTVGALVHSFLDAIVDDYFPLMDEIADRAEELEDTIFEHYSEEAIEGIFAMKKDLLVLRRIVAPERDVLNVLLRRELPIFQPADVAYLQDVYDHIVRVTDNIDTYRDLLSSALDSYLSLQSNHLNQIVKVLTITSIILMAASLVTGFYGMNFANMPELNWRIGHLWALILIVVITGVLALYFKRLKWW
ncbi:MAG: magnesium/cobalt transporter CorA [Anaerolineae bacterium]|jgi:magnesium transporter|nr:magnesium/cobalt transporter CorA [Anaerolineae bacterium]